MRTLLALTAASLLSAQLRADEAVLPDGRRLAGELVLGRDGRLRFQPAREAEALPITRVEQVRFPAVTVPPRFPLMHQVVLRDWQRLTGELLGLDGQAVRLQTDWAGPATFPRSAVAAVVQTPGFVTAFVDDFENDLRAWTLTGQPVRDEREHTSARSGLLLTAAGQSATYILPSPLEAGRVGLNFLDAEVSPGVHGRVVFVFQTPNGSRELRVTVVDGDGKAAGVELPNRVRWGTRAARTGGWRRLRVEFSADSLEVLVDDLVLFAGRGRGPGGPLRQCRVVREGGKNSGGQLWFDDWNVARRVEDLPHPEGDPGQDEVWLASGDQLFGSVPKADRRAIELHARFGNRSMSWAEVRGLWLREAKFSAPVIPGEQVRLRLRPVDGFEPDRLDGVVESLDRERLVLRHALLGKVVLPRERLHRLDPSGPP
jgi:hypothetical protein